MTRVGLVLRQAATVVSRPGAGTQPTSHRRMDIQGLRAIAVGLVVLNHAGAGWLPGGYVGVDVFFVISGFLITGLLLKEARSSGRISLGNFYARRAKRILPAASVVLVATAVLTMQFLPRGRLEETAWQIIGSALYVVNWMLADQAVDYLNADAAPSAVQHFWTLAVEEQFYLLWPLLVLLAVHFSRRSIASESRTRETVVRKPTRQRLIVAAILTVTVPSLAWSIWQTEQNPAAAYFQTTTRLWELGIGACVAVFAVSLRRLPAGSARVLGWGGLAAIAVAALFFDTQTPFPSYYALLPTCGAAAIIVAGMGTERDAGVGALLSTRPMVWVGDLSYSLYLWHWPLIVVATYQLGGSIHFSQGLVVVAGATVLSYLSWRFIEQPILNARSLKVRPRRALAMGALLMSVGCLAGVGMLTFAPTVPPPADLASKYTTLKSKDGKAPQKLLGAAYLAAHPRAGIPTNDPGDYTPDPSVAAEDNPDVYASDCHRSSIETDPVACTYGKRGAKFKVAIVGDSHAAQWVPALQVLADDYGWEVSSYTKSRCPLVDAQVVPPGGAEGAYASCEAWNRNVHRELARSAPDLVITSTINPTPIVDGVKLSGAAAQSALGAGFRGAWSKVTANGSEVVSLVDTPRPNMNVPECMELNASKPRKCAVSRAGALAGHGAAERIGASGLKRVSVIDLNRFICPAKRCAAVIGGVLVYRDATHITATYSTTLAGPLHDALVSVKRVPAP